jgi:oligopeptide transport system substrate-binding protein
MTPARRLTLCITGLLGALSLASCAVSSADSGFFGKTDAPPGQTLRYVSGDEPESIDPQVPTGQPEARILMALFEGLCEYDPKTTAPIPAIAETWEANADSTEFTFHLRNNARFSNGDPITAHDFVYTFRRGLSPELAARNAYLAYYVAYGQGYNEGGVFARDAQNGQYVMDGAFRRVFPGDEAGRKKLLDADPRLKAETSGKEFVPIQAEDIGVEAVDDYTLHIRLEESAPFFVSLMPHQFFRVVSQKAIEKYGRDRWAQPGTPLVSSGPFKLKQWVPYDKLVVVRDPMYWDAANVKLDEIRFYPLIDNPTIMNLYKAGEVDGSLNHSVPNAWLDVMEQLKDYMDAPEMASEYYQINTLLPPMNDLRVRQAFSLAIDRLALAKYRHQKPNSSFVPEGVFHGYSAVGKAALDVERAKQLMVAAGYKDSSGKYDPSKFPVSETELTYNTNDNNKQVAEFVQAQWKQNLGITIPIKNMEWKTFLDTRARLDYKGFARSGWIGDYMDPFSYLNIFYTPKGDNGTGWWDPRYVAMLDDANRTLDHQARYDKLAKAEAYMLANQPVIPLLEQSTRWMKKPYVKGMYPNPGTMHAWKFVYIEHDPAKWDYGVPDMTP